MLPWLFFHWWIMSRTILRPHHTDIKSLRATTLLYPYTLTLKNVMFLSLLLYWYVSCFMYYYYCYSEMMMIICFFIYLSFFFSYFPFLIFLTFLPLILSRQRQLYVNSIRAKLRSGNMFKKWKCWLLSFLCFFFSQNELNQTFHELWELSTKNPPYLSTGQSKHIFSYFDISITKNNQFP